MSLFHSTMLPLGADLPFYAGRWRWHFYLPPWRSQTKGLVRRSLSATTLLTYVQHINPALAVLGAELAEK